MCGRISISTTPAQILEAFEEVQGPEALDELDTPRYNLGPTSRLPAIRVAEEGEREWAVFQWGLVPRWAKDSGIGYKTFNARSETVATKPSFRDAYRKRRCLLPITGLYEWQKTDAGKQPHLIHLPSETLFTLAGLWETWISPDGVPHESCTVVTTTPNRLLSNLHDRMPVIVDRAEHDVWLTGSTDDAKHVMRPFAQDRMEAYPVSTFVSNVRNEGPECVKRVEERG